MVSLASAWLAMVVSQPSRVFWFSGSCSVAETMVLWEEIAASLSFLAKPSISCGLTTSRSTSEPETVSMASFRSAADGSESLFIAFV